MQRREFLRMMAGTTAFATLPTVAIPPSQQRALNPTDEHFLDEMQRRSCLYFVEQASHSNGQVLDRAAASIDGKLDPRRMTSIAATGFGLSALCIADKRGYFPHATMVEQVVRTLRFHADELYNNHGFFYHFNDIETGARFARNEVSSIDTALLLCGVLTARAHFHNNSEVQRYATKIYERVDWPWMLNGGKTFSMGWNPESGFIAARWNHYCELMMIYLLAMGSQTHPVDADCWDAWSRDRMSYAGYEYIGGGDPLFVHQYSQAWFDFRGKRDRYANYFENSVTATRAHKAFCLKLGKPYSEDYWGISASDSAHGYTAWGGPSPSGESFGGVDGSVVPNAVAGSLPFLPDDCLRVLRSLKTNYGQQAWGRYSFCDALHPAAAWYDPDVLGIDLGISVVMAENLRSGFVWETFARNPEVGIAMKRAGFRPG
ncbi:glucoamylase family protein [Granulicella paludicola]|uniref:glucoamylase family protein n=1 Tax=Granulicella paludicola TaxID=474951 RepID=UPI0021DF588F|nr:glucoamylase family protein [Granulicella paludicola]